MKHGMCPINIITFCSFVHDLQLNIWVLFNINHCARHQTEVHIWDAHIWISIDRNFT